MLISIADSEITSAARMPKTNRLFIALLAFLADLKSFAFEEARRGFPRLIRR
jgi:hypothetical protein